MTDKNFLFLNEFNNYEEAAANSTLALGGLTMSGTIAMGTNKITGLGNGTESTDAATFGQLQSALEGLYWVDPVAVLRIKSGANQAGTPPTAGSAGEAWLVSSWGSGYNNGDIVEWSGTAWVVVVANSGGEPPSMTRVIVIESGAGAPFAGNEEAIAEYNSALNTWSFTTAVDGLAAFIIGDGGYYADSGFTFNGTNWVQFSGTGQVIAGSGLDKAGNTLSVKTGNGVTIDDDHVALSLTTDSGLTFSGLTNHLRTVGVLANTAQGIHVDNLGIGVSIDSNLGCSGTGLYVTGVPTSFTINGSGTNGTYVTAGNLDDLVDGSDATALHTHLGAFVLRNSVKAHENLLKGNPVYQYTDVDEVAKADADTEATASNVLGVALADISANGTGLIVTYGLALGVLGTAGVAGTRYYVASGGGLTTTPPASGKNICLVGWAKNTADLWVEPRWIGKRA